MTQITRIRRPAHALLTDVSVLVVDDNAINGRVLEEMLTEWQMRPTVVDTGQSALVSMDRALNSNEPFSVVLLDAYMPGMDGFEVAEWIKQRPSGRGDHSDAALRTPAR